jgi:hypothetical protein
LVSASSEKDDRQGALAEKRNNISLYGEITPLALFYFIFSSSHIVRLSGGVCARDKRRTCVSVGQREATERDGTVIFLLLYPFGVASMRYALRTDRAPIMGHIIMGIHTWPVMSSWKEPPMEI